MWKTCIGQADSVRVSVGSGSSFFSVTFVAPNRGSIATEFANCQNRLELALNMLSGMERQFADRPGD